MGANYNNNKKKQNRPSVFKQMVQQKGPDFMTNLDSISKSRMANKAVRDLVRGNVDLETEGIYFCDATFLQECIKWLNMKYKLHAINSNALTFYTQSNGLDQDTSMILDFDSKSAKLFSILLENFNLLLTTGNIAWLNVAVSNIRSERLGHLI